MIEMTDDRIAHRDWLLSFFDLQAGQRVVDLGCGRGGDLLALASRHAGLPLRMIGLDSSEVSLDAARALASHDSRLIFQQHHLGEKLPFEDAEIDAVYSHNLLECLADPRRFAAEVARVLRTGGQLVIGHWDWDSQLFDGADKALIRRLVHGFSDWQQSWMEHADGWMGRRLWGVFNSSGTFSGTVQARSLINTSYDERCFGFAIARSFRSLVKRGLASAADVEAFDREQARLSEEGRFFYSLTGYAYVGRRAGGS
jgi:SAM-dependent methyltransferase